MTVDARPGRRPHTGRHAQAATPAELAEAVAAISNAAGDAQSVMDAATAVAMSVTHAHGAAIEVVEGDDMVYRSAAGSVADFRGLRLRLLTSLSGICVSSRQTLTAHDTENDPRVDREACRRIGVRSMVVVPLQDDAITIGVLKVMSARRAAFHAADVSAVEALARVTADRLTALQA